MDGPSFEEIETTDDFRCGPEAVLVCGFGQDIAPRMAALLEKAQASTHRLVFCTRSMVKQRLEQALNRTDDEPPAGAEELPRVMVLSGMNGSQLRAFLTSYAASGLPRPIFASSTPTNLGFAVSKLLLDLLQEQREQSNRR